ncbi:ATP-binding cassette domain-containing protein [Rhizobium sp. Root1204]|uniref:ATP-binding cassette domain-containing protein n=1 Tax=Rhizobium sp. Root1204 TaxID=1736428 RepID=UPI00071500A3|nr:ATP-binding cassette domain-containing protein [Rhizobium sp. Root1204]KQV41346.1 hypothetical protein ASC96_18825 [Rhizobium sp. Root1204]
MTIIQPIKQAMEQVAEPVLSLSGVTKSFGSVQALKGIDFVAYSGEVHAIVGENGAGKSTLINCAAGVLKPDAGEIQINGSMAADSPSLVRQLGLSVAFQHPALSPDLTVLENLRLVRPSLTRGEANTILSRVTTEALAMTLDKRAGGLSLAQGHVLEIARALTSQPSVLILDEPTEPFQDPEVRHLFSVIADLKKSGTAIVYISHRLHEVMSIADRISVLRDGEMIETRMAAGITTTEIIDLIVGRPLGQVFPQKAGKASGDPILTAATLSGRGFSDVTLDLRPGEIVGLAGVDGQGQREFLRALAGINEITSGSLRIGRDTVRASNVAQFRALGVGFVPDDRHKEGLALPFSIRENEGLGQLKEISVAGIVSGQREKKLAEEIHASFRIKAPSVQTTVASLSGGNQQKVLIGREIARKPRVLLIDEPTKGVDVGSRSDIYGKIRGLAADGAGVVMASADGVEIEGLCDRVLVFSRGAVIAELTGAEVNDERITEANLNATGVRQNGSGGERKKPHGLGVFAASDHGPAALLLILSILVACGTQWLNPSFFTDFNLSSIALLTTVLGLAAFAQLFVMLTGGIDLSVGPLAGLAVVLASFLLTEEPQFGLLGGSILIVLACAVFGLLQGALVELLRLPAIVVTLATYTGLQGISLTLRPSPDGTIGDSFMSGIQYAIGPLPVVSALVILGGFVLEHFLLNRPIGRALRAMGSNPKAAGLIGIDRVKIGVMAFTLSGLFAGLAGLLMASQVGIGSATTGVNYTLMGVTAVVLGGTQITGGRGSFVASLCGGLFVQTIVSALPFLNLEAVWQYWIVGACTFAAAGLFARLRRKSV